MSPWQYELDAKVAPYQCEWQGRQVWLGTGEVWCEHPSGVIYVAPNLIYHYVKDVHYLPPPEFVEAVIDGAALDF